MVSIYWLIAFVVLTGIELVTMALTTIWFAGGALIAFILSVIGVSTEIQLVTFVITSFILLVFTRPFASGYINKNTTKTNAEGIIGKRARVTEEINNELETGTAVVGGQEWTARAETPGMIFTAGTVVEVKEIKGVKIIVGDIKEEK